MEYWLDDDKNPVDEFTNFHFAQASAAILDNLGFSAATTDAIEIMSSLMRRYFDDLCHRVSNFSENAGRQSATISDLNMAFKSQNISISELHEYVQQVRTLSLPTSTLPLYPSAEFVDSKSETKFFFADPFDDHVPAVEEVELLYGKRKPPVENGVPEESGEGSKPTEEGEKPDSGIDSMQVEPIENPEPTVVWQLPDFKGIPDFSALSADDLGFDMELFNQKHQEAEMRKTAKANISHTRSKPPVLSDSTLKSAETALKQTSLNSLVDKIKKHKNKEKKRLKDKKKDKERVGAHGEKSRHRKKHRDPYPKEAPVLTPATTLGELLKPTAPVFPSATAPILPAAVSAPPVVSTPPPVLSAAAPPPVKAPERFETPKPLPKPASPVPLPPTKVEATSNNNVEKPPAKPVLTPPPPLEQAAPVVKVKTPVPDQPLTTPQPPPVANELKKDKSHKKDKEKKREKKKEKKRDKERDPTKSAERNKEKKNKEKRRSAGDKSTIQMPSLAREADASGLMTSMRTPPPETTPSTAIATANGHGTEETSTRTDPPPRISPAENAPVKLTIRIGRTASNDSVKHSPQEASAPQKTSPTNTPPLLSQEPAAPSETPAMVEKLLVKRDFEPAAGGDPDEPPRKKHKSMKKEKRDKEQRDSLGGEAEKSEKHKKKSKEHKEKRKMRDGEAKPVPSTSTTPIPPAKEAKNGDPVVSPLKMPKLSAPEVKPEGVDKDPTEKAKKKDKEHKKHKKEKKHKKDREEPSAPKSAERPQSSSSHSQPKIPSVQKTKPPKPAAPPSLPMTTIEDALRNAPPVLTAETSVRSASTKPPKEKPSKSKVFERTSSSNSLKEKAPKKPKKSTSKTPEPPPPAPKDPSPALITEDAGADDDVWVCPICSVAYVDGVSDMIGCDGGCDRWFHWHCVGMLKAPDENEPWFCPDCRKKNKGKRKKGF